ncbi:unnamed protein product [Didymodactylos carnosus]|uniref:Uncharacterized protein n=1 Tax=Didymodactylos carnosus TaxID=1234261 RepID=A0A814FST3_9BILA|nr:unnamed protein product [Didymodactylos carnosus]CAF1002207.1 unnamed protein product [Didymodactylos carnosus]CAF3759989.1 unnamed protein product [Didymodactylos carnosus]CAF3771580.1 unnamed protein product [Didymodactylos carnosus]
MSKFHTYNPSADIYRIFDHHERQLRDRHKNLIDVLYEWQTRLITTVEQHVKEKMNELGAQYNRTLNKMFEQRTEFLNKADIYHLNKNDKDIKNLVNQCELLKFELAELTYKHRDSLFPSIQVIKTEPVEQKNISAFVTESVDSNRPMTPTITDKRPSSVTDKRPSSGTDKRLSSSMSRKEENVTEKPQSDFIVNDNEQVGTTIDQGNVDSRGYTTGEFSSSRPASATTTGKHSRQSSSKSRKDENMLTIPTELHQSDLNDAENPEITTTNEIQLNGKMNDDIEEKQ